MRQCEALISFKAEVVEECNKVIRQIGAQRLQQMELHKQQTVIPSKPSDPKPGDQLPPPSL